MNAPSIAVKTDLLGMGTGGRAGVGRLVVGAVAEEVERRAERAVLVGHVPTAGG
jgi:hypothetical protein